jgi:hypothetical protein
MSGCGEGQVTAPHIYEPMRFILGFFDCKLDQKQKQKKKKKKKKKKKNYYIKIKKNFK